MRLTRARAAMVAAVAVMLGVALVVLAADRSSQPASSPIDAPGSWGHVLVAGLVLAFAAYVVGVVALARLRSSLLLVLAVAAVVQLAPLAGPTLLSTDVWTYWMYGRVGAELDGNPYGDPPSRFAGDVAFEVMGSSWRETPSLYGPLFTLGSEAHAAVAGDDPDVAAWLYRAVAALCAIGSAAAAACIGRRRSFAAGFVGWNPLLALHFAGGGHNDALMMLCVLIALALAARGSPNLAGAAWLAAIGIKWVAAAFLALWAIDRIRQREPIGLVGLGAATLGLAAAATARYGTTWLHAFEGLSSQARRTGSIGLSKWLGDLGLGHRPTLAVIGLAALVAFAWLGLQAWRGHLRLGVAGTVAAIGQGWLNPWYASWGVSLSAADEDRLAWALAIGLTGFLLLDVVPR